MYRQAEQLLDQVEQGTLSRRDAVGRLVALAAATFAGGSIAAQGKAAPKEPTFQSVGLNHIALRVTDIPRSRKFYESHLGLSVLQESEHNCFLGAGENNFVALFPAKSAGLDHYCYTIETYEAGQVVEKLARAGIEPRRTANRVYFDDPDGIEVQLASEWGDYPRSRG